MFTLIVEQDVDMMRSTFIAYGLAELIYRIPPPGTSIDVVVENRSGYYEVRSSIDLQQLLNYVRTVNRLPVLIDPILKFTKKEKESIEQGTPSESYSSRYIPVGATSWIDFDKEASLSQNSHGSGYRVEGQENAAKRLLPLWRRIAEDYSGKNLTKTYLQLVHSWQSLHGDSAIQFLQLVALYYSGNPSDQSEAVRMWQRIKRKLDYALPKYIGSKTTALAIISPSTSRGSRSTSNAKAPNQVQFELPWWDIYFAFAGFMVAGMPYRANRDPKKSSAKVDLLTCYPIPRQITVRTLHSLMIEYRKSNRVEYLIRSSHMPHQRTEILNGLIFGQEFLLGQLRNTQEALQSRRIPKQPDVLDSVVTYHYKHLGKAPIPFNEASFRLPNWVSANSTSKQLDSALNLLKEHYQLIDRLQQRNKEGRWSVTTDELQVIEKYGEFVAYGDASSWIDFCSAYGEHWFLTFTVRQDKTKFKRLVSLYVDVVEDTLRHMNHNYSEIFENRGFREIAAAIRECTVRLIWRTKRMSSPEHSHFKIRYGLGHDIRQVAHDKRLLLQFLSDFINDYQSESFNILSSAGEDRGRDISPGSLEEFSKLLEIHNSDLIARLLVAEGYAFRRPRKDANHPGKTS
jgi:hypothetical protein